jgi:hypothetical protein
MARLLVHVEGQTEESFVNEVLRDHLVSQGYYSVEARLVGNARQHQRGGIRKWPSARRDIIKHLLEDQNCIATTMVDYYGLSRTWPGRERSESLRSIEQKAQCVEDAVRNEVSEEIGTSFNTARFVPFVVMHEFEGLLFSDCGRFSREIGHPELKVTFQNIRDHFATPEEINDSPVTAPSKRVKELVPSYEKPLFGVLAVLEIGLLRIRAECPHFDGWLKQLESRAR